MSWFDDQRGAMSGRGRVRPQPVTTAPATATDEYAYDGDSPILPNGQPNPNYKGNTGTAGDQSGTAVTPPAATTRTTPPPPGVSSEKWASGHVSPKYAWKEVGGKHNLKTQAGKDAALAELKQRYPQYFANASWDGDDGLRIDGDLHKDFNGIRLFDVIKDADGAAVPRWGTPEQDAINRATVEAQRAAQQAAAGGGATGAPGSSPMNTGQPGQLGSVAPAGGYGVDSGQGFGALMQPWEYEFAFPYFQAPEGEEVFKDPGYLFRQEQGNKAIERSAAASGTVLNPATVKALQDYNSGLASQEYGNVYNRRLGEHGRAHDQAFNEFSTAYNVFNRNQDTPFNRLAAIAGLGQTSAGQLGAAGSAFGANYGNTAMQGAGAASDYLTQGANATAAGRVGGANAWSNALSNTGNNVGQSYYNWQYMRPRTQSSPFNFGTPVDVGGLG